jgi:hypothetical protein
LRFRAPLTSLWPSGGQQIAQRMPAIADTPNEDAPHSELAAVKKESGL